jgi:predicted dithiol-disulfide oxidoreductase (DUF899 family)
VGLHHDVRFPGESEEYRRARDELLQGEIEERRLIRRLAEQRSALPLGGEAPTDYQFEEWDEGAGGPRPVRLSELFAPGKDSLFLYSFMWVPEEQGLPFVGPCPSCTSIIDGIDGQVPHIRQAVNFAVSTKAPIEQFHEYARSRGWRHARLISAVNNGYNGDYKAEDENEFQWPLATVFVRRDGRIHHFWSCELWMAPRDPGIEPRHVDFMWPMWALFDRTPDGRGDFFPAREYAD